MLYDLLVVGGGAAGFFAAIQAAEQKPGLKILILEKSTKVLAKVKVSGGGRCNVTHHNYVPRELSGHYPRGEKLLRELFKTYQARDVVHWFERNGVTLKAEDDGRMFPTTDNSQTIIDCFLRKIQQYGIRIEMSKAVAHVARNEDAFTIDCLDHTHYRARTVLIAAGGHPQATAYEWIAKTGHTVIPPIPSLFTFNDPSKVFHDLMGLSVEEAVIKIAGTKFLQKGPVLITHWGLSGPAVIKLSAWAAEYLHQHQYNFQVLVSWIGDVKEETLRAELLAYKQQFGKRKIMSWPLYSVPQRLWVRLCEQAEIADEKVWMEVSTRSVNKLIEGLIRTAFHIKGKTTFKEEFVTCGGVELREIDPQTMESRIVSGLFFAGEVLNIDGETGGFNFQAAWSTAYVAAKAIIHRIDS